MPQARGEREERYNTMTEKGSSSRKLILQVKHSNATLFAQVHIVADVVVICHYSSINTPEQHISSTERWLGVYGRHNSLAMCWQLHLNPWQSIWRASKGGFFTQESEVMQEGIIPRLVSWFSEIYFAFTFIANLLVECTIELWGSYHVSASWGGWHSSLTAVTAKAIVACGIRSRWLMKERPIPCALGGGGGGKDSSYEHCNSWVAEWDTMRFLWERQEC